MNNHVYKTSTCTKFLLIVFVHILSLSYLNECCENQSLHQGTAMQMVPVSLWLYCVAPGERTVNSDVMS